MEYTCAFVTGGSGLLGANIIKELLLNTSAQVIALIRNPSGKKRAQLYDDIIAFNRGIWPGEFPYRRIEIVDGDVTLPDLGLASNVREQVIREADIIYHSAAVIKLSGAQEEVQAANVSGTQSLLHFAMACKERGRLDKVIHVSTVAVSGNREGIVYEDELDRGQSFNNPYEKSKFEAEKVVQEYRNRGLNTLIVRPSMVIGDSATGFTNHFNMFYFQLRLLSQGILDVIPLHQEAAYNLVPVDYTAKAICLISQNEHGNCRNFHIVNPFEMTVTHFMRKVCDYLGYELPQLIDLQDYCPLSSAPHDGMRGRLLDMYVPYVSTKKIFDSTNAQDVFSAHGFMWPAFDDMLLTRILDGCIYSGYLRLGTEVKREARAYNA